MSSSLDALLGQNLPHKRSPIRTACFRAALSKDTMSVFLSKEYAVWDWLRLGVFTGSPLSKYAQSRLRKHQQFQTIPVNDETGVWGGKPLAFIRSDFQFFDHNESLISHKLLSNLHRRGLVRSVHVRFRYDKGAENFSVRKYSATDDSILDPVNAVVSLLHQFSSLLILRTQIIPLSCCVTSKPSSNIMRELGRLFLYRICPSFEPRYAISTMTAFVSVTRPIWPKSCPAFPTNTIQCSPTLG